jgi:hypothetical protein
MNRSYDYAQCRDLGFSDAEVSACVCFEPAGQSGATQQISDTPIADSESVDELAEGNAFEANAIYGVNMREIRVCQK